MNGAMLQNLRGIEWPMGPYPLGQERKQRHGSAAANNDREQGKKPRLVAMSTRHFSSIIIQSSDLSYQGYLLVDMGLLSY